MSAEPNNWERVQGSADRVTRRLPVPGGWLYQVHELDYGAVMGQHLVSVPKPTAIPRPASSCLRPAARSNHPPNGVTHMQQRGRKSAAALAVVPAPQPAPSRAKRGPSVRPPAGLAPATAKWFRAVVVDYELEPHHERLLELACRAWDRAEQARVLLDLEGLTGADRHGVPKAHPATESSETTGSCSRGLVRELGPGHRRAEAGSVAAALGRVSRALISLTAA
jgi:phage terminase small subunit